LLLARVAARPVDGAANEALRRLMADALDIAPSRVKLASGATARTKRLELDGVTADAIRSRWPGVEV
jgi:uncharacterized protein YggU (UPF0235/DUF167 family)